VLNPVLFALLDRYLARGKPAADLQAAAEQALREPLRPTELSGHVVLVGFGRVGFLVAQGVWEQGIPILLIEENRPLATRARIEGLEVLHGNAASAEVLEAANLPGARHLIVAIPDAFEGGQIVMQARKLNPTLPIIARSHSEEETAHLKSLGATTVIMGEREIAMAMLADVQSGGQSGAYR
jgi:CPA2 family monovalent cation:H+ antiporter-2